MTLPNRFILTFLLSALCPSLVLADAPCPNAALSLPAPQLPEGQPRADIPIENIIVIMQENRSFDHYFGRLSQPQFYGSAIDGIQLGPLNVGPVPVLHNVVKTPQLCFSSNPSHAWSSMHRYWNAGKMDRFSSAPRRLSRKDPINIAVFDETQIPFYYGLANRFAVADRFFSSVLGPTYPNRQYLLAATSAGRTSNARPANPTELTIFDRLNAANISWKVYSDSSHGVDPITHTAYRGYLGLFYRRVARDPINVPKQVPVAQFDLDLKAGTLPQVVFLDSDKQYEEHPPSNVQIGQHWVEQKVRALLSYPAIWKKSALFFVYDEGGGFFDHVPPPEACHPDGIKPISAAAAKFDFVNLGFRVPFIAVSPYAKPHYVSHLTYDHTSILKFIETKFNLRSLTKRDANANDLLDLFDFTQSVESLPPIVLPDGNVTPGSGCPGS